MSVSTSQPASRPFGLRGWLLIAVINLLWGFNIIAAKMAVELLQPFTAAFLRQAMVGLICLPFLRIVPGRMLVLLGFAISSGAAMILLLNTALSISDNVGALAVVGQMGVPFAVFLSILFLGERTDIWRIGGLVLAFSGVALISFDPAMMNEVPAVLIMTLSTLGWALGSLLTRRLSGVPIGVLYAWLGLISALALAPFMLLLEPGTVGRLAGASWQAYGWVAFSAIGSSLIGHGGISWLIQRYPIGQVMPYTLIAPVVSVIVATWMFDTAVTAMMVLGGIVVLGGVAVITLRSAREGKMVEDLS